MVKSRPLYDPGMLGDLKGLIWLGMLLLISFSVLAGAAGSVLVTPHADAHPEAEQIRRCIQNLGPEQVWLSNEYEGIEYWLCQIPDGRWCVQINQVWNSAVDGADYRERTAFCPGDGTKAKVLRYLRRFASPGGPR